MSFKVSQIHYLLFVSFFFLNSCNLLNDGDKKDTGEIIWEKEHQISQLIMVQPLIDDDRVFFYQDGYLKSSLLKKYDIIWEDKISESASSGSFRNTLSDNSSLYIDRGFWFRSYDRKTGEINWHKDFTNDGSEFSGLGGARISQDEEFLYLPRIGRVLKAQKENGEIVHEFILDRLVPNGIIQGATDPLPSPFGDNLIYIPTAYWDISQQPNLLRGNLFAFDRHSGQLIWEFQTPDKVLPTDEFEATDSLLVESAIFDIELSEEYVVVAALSTIILLDRNTGELIWHIPLKDRRFEGVPGYENNFGGVDVGLTIDDTGLYIVTLDGSVRKLDWVDGSEIWSIDVTYSNTSIPTVIDGLLYFTNSGGGGIWVVDTMTGEVLFNSNPPGYSNDSHDVYLSSLGVGNGYMVNVGSKKVYALKSFE